MKNRNLKHSDHWATDPTYYAQLNKQYNFDFDPCPYRCTEFDGLKIEWGQRNFVNPPYSPALKEAFIKKAIKEKMKGKLSVCLLPVSTSTKLFHDIIKPNADEIILLKGRKKFIGINSKGQYVNWHLWDKKAPEGVEHVKNGGQHDSMLVVFKPNVKSICK